MFFLSTEREQETIATRCLHAWTMVMVILGFQLPFYCGRVIEQCTIKAMKIKRICFAKIKNIYISTYIFASVVLKVQDFFYHATYIHVTNPLLNTASGFSDHNIKKVCLTALTGLANTLYNVKCEKEEHRFTQLRDVSRVNVDCHLHVIGR